MDFKKGEIAIGQNFVYNTQWNNMECEVVTNLKSCYITELNDDPCKPYYADLHNVVFANGEKGSVKPIYLRKRHEPGNWEDLKDEFGKPIWNSMITAGEG